MQLLAQYYSEESGLEECLRYDLFLPRDAMLSAVYTVVVCVSVCVSVILRYCNKMAKCRITHNNAAR